MAADVSPAVLIHRTPHDAAHPYLRLRQATAQDTRLSLAARGLLMYLLSLSDTWQIEPRHLASVFDLNIETIRNLLKELSHYGYVKLREQINDARGYIAWSDYEVYEGGNAAKSAEDASKPKVKKSRPISARETRNGFTEAGQTQALEIKESRKTTKESPAEMHPAEISETSPDGEARVDDSVKTPQPSEQGRAEQTVNSVLVKAQLAHQPQATTIPQDSLPRPKPIIPRAASPQPQPAVTHSHHPSPMQAAIAHAFKVSKGSYAGKIGQFFAGKIPRRKDLWGRYQPETPATPQEVIALLVWYSRHPAYAVSCAEHGGKLPSTPAILRDRLDEFREAVGYDAAMTSAQSVLERLLRGEAVAMTPPAASSPGPIESVEAYKPYNAQADQGYQRTVDHNTASVFDQLFGGSS